MHKTPSFLLLILLFATISACEGGTIFTKTISNNSSETITVQLFTPGVSTQVVTISPQQSKEIYADDQQGVFVGDLYTCIQDVDSIQFSLSNNKTLIKDIFNPENWTRESKDGRKSREDCTFSFEDGDLQ